MAVLLVSPEFLASKFIAENELPLLLKASQKEGLTILWIPVRPSHYTRTVIAKYQAAHDPEKPLSGMNRAKQDGALVEIVKKIEAIAPPSSSPSTAYPPSTPATPPAIIRPAFALPSIQNVHGWSAPQVRALQSQIAQVLKSPVEFRDTLEDGSPGPTMVVIPGGRFLMGSPPDEPERRDNERQHEVEVASFALGKYAVTFEEYDRFATMTKREKSDGQGWGRMRRPVINVAWFDAMVYAEWLSQQTGQTYRLPTEAEWEYACRAGTTTPFYFGTTISPRQARYGLSDGTVEVGQFPANAWGLHDMHGNVWEWTGSEYDEGYGGAELRTVSDPNASVRQVLRGGSWDVRLEWLRSASRYRRDPCDGNPYVGFRLARTLAL